MGFCWRCQCTFYAKPFAHNNYFRKPEVSTGSQHRKSSTSGRASFPQSKLEIPHQRLHFLHLAAQIVAILGYSVKTNPSSPRDLKSPSSLSPLIGGENPEIWLVEPTSQLVSSQAGYCHRFHCHSSVILFIHHRSRFVICRSRFAHRRSRFNHFWSRFFHQGSNSRIFVHLSYHFF